MFTLRVFFLMIPIGMVVAAGGVWTAAMTPPRAFHHAGWLSTTVSDTESGLETVAAQPHVDVYGNEIEDAVGDYRIDLRGDVYERHSPETEVPRLAPPII